MRLSSLLGLVSGTHTLSTPTYTLHESCPMEVPNCIIISSCCIHSLQDTHHRHRHSLRPQLFPQPGFHSTGTRAFSWLCVPYIPKRCLGRLNLSLCFCVKRSQKEQNADSSKSYVYSRRLLVTCTLVKQYFLVYTFVLQRTSLTSQ